MDREKAIKAVADFLTAVGEDVTREGLKDTPARVADMYAELLAGNGDDAAKHLSKTFAVQSGNIVIEKDITFSSMCEHHLMPFFGKMAIAYIPQGKAILAPQAIGAIGIGRVISGDNGYVSEPVIQAHRTTIVGDGVGDRKKMVIQEQCSPLPLIQAIDGYCVITGIPTGA